MTAVPVRMTAASVTMGECIGGDGSTAYRQRGG